MIKKYTCQVIIISLLFLILLGSGCQEHWQPGAKIEHGEMPMLNSLQTTGKLYFQDKLLPLTKPLYLGEEGCIRPWNKP